MSQPPKFYLQAKEEYPEVFASYEALGKAVRDAGPLDAKTVALVKLASSVASGLEGATRRPRVLISGAQPATTSAATTAIAATGPEWRGPKRRLYKNFIIVGVL